MEIQASELAMQKIIVILRELWYNSLTAFAERFAGWQTSRHQREH